jgi:hypothetical protein
MEGSDTLLTLAEIAVGLAGFSAIVVIFKRRDAGTWLATDADRFHGMIVHSMVAALLCFVPAAVAVFSDAPRTIWALSSGLLGVQVLAHTLLVLRLASTSGPSRLAVALGGGAVVVLQGLNVLGLGFDREPGPYVLGVLWHLVHAGILFVMLVWVRGEAIEEG